MRCDGGSVLRSGDLLETETTDVSGGIAHRCHCSNAIGKPRATELPWHGIII
jgi:hypothetical protein